MLRLAGVLLTVTLCTLACITVNPAQPAPATTPTPTTTATATPTPTPAPAPTPTAGPTLTPTPTRSPSLTQDPTMTPRPAVAPSPTPTPFIPPVSTTPTPTPSPALVHNVEDLVARVKPAVVRLSRGGGTGSGVFYEIEAMQRTPYILTNYHVVDEATQVDVLLESGQTYIGEAIWTDSQRDLAIVDVTCCLVPTARPLGIPLAVDAPRDGAKVIAMGFPLGFYSVRTTRGIVASGWYDTQSDSWWIQSDAATNPGNSGGPLLNVDREIVGINTSREESSASGRPVEGINYAVSTVTIQEVIPSHSELNAKPSSVPTPVARATPRPTPAPTPEPTETPTPTPTIIPTPRPTTIPTPETPSHSCSLAVMTPADTMLDNYSYFVSAHFMDINPAVKPTLLGWFPEVAGAYIVEFIDDPLKYASFRDFLQRVNFVTDIVGADEAVVKAKLQDIQGRGLLPSADESMGQYNQRLASDPCTAARIRVFRDDDIMTILAVGVAREVSTGVAQRYAVDATMRGINAYRWDNPTTPLIYFILRYIQ